MAVLYLILLGPLQDSWTWRVVDERGEQIASAKREFRYYLEVLADARAHGYGGTPQFQSSETPSDD